MKLYSVSIKLLRRFIINRLAVYWYYFIGWGATKLGLYETELYYTINRWLSTSARLDVDRVLWLPKKNVAMKL